MIQVTKLFKYIIPFLLFVACTNNIEKSAEIASIDDLPFNRDRIPKELDSIISNSYFQSVHWRLGSQPNDKIKIRYPKFYFSPDSSKCIIIATTQLETKNDPGFELNLDSFIGYKSNGLWKVFCFKASIYRGYHHYNIEDNFINYLENGDFKKVFYVKRYNNGVKSEGPIGFSVGETGFWDSQLWQQNLEVKGRYEFELHRNSRGEVEVVLSLNELLEKNLKKD